MDRRRLMLDAGLGAAVVVLSGLAWSQHGEIARLDDALARVEARLDAPSALPTEESATPREGVRPAPEGIRPLALAQPSKMPVQSPTPLQQPTQDPSAAPTSPSFDPADPVVRSQLREVIAQEEEARQEERWQRRDERREQRLRERVTELAQKTGLDTGSTEQLTDLLVVEQAEISQLFREARQDFSFEEARDKAAAVRAETDARAREILDDEAIKEYDQMREEEAARWRGPGFGPPTDARPASPREPR